MILKDVITVIVDHIQIVLSCCKLVDKTSTVNVNFFSHTG